MDARRWAEMEPLYHAALEQPSEQRSSFLLQACQGDDELLHQLELLLAQDLGGTGPLDQPLKIGTTSLWEEVGLARPAARVPNPHSPVLAGEFAGTSGDGRFPTGTVVAGRYLIISLVGCGGMGEVYRADDLLLKQTVALKFLPALECADAAALSRFRNEVRIARQVSHPNICRIHDIGETEGVTYLTMEFVDGEDLAVLLRRIGRLPRDKVLQIASELCAGLAAAHKQGIVHRDLKPANIILDTRGHVRITDFGLAGLAEQLRDLGSGTPGYMAPEQQAGQEVTQRSDIYALGVVLHEFFTGVRPGQEGGYAELDPASESAIQSCLEEDPRKRPLTVLALAAALPGCNPLIVALAADETPSPDIVARSGPVQGLKSPVALALLTAVILSLGALFFIRQKADLLNRIPMENTSVVLAAKAREIAGALGYGTRPADRAFGWQYDSNYLNYVRKQNNAIAYMGLLRTNQPPAIRFWYRESPQRLIPANGFAVTLLDPWPAESGMLHMLLDSDGTLIRFDARPGAHRSESDQTQADNWARLLASAHLDGNRLAAVQPQLIPSVAFDAQAAWVYTTPQGQFRIEAATWQSRPVFFRRSASWIPAEDGSTRSRASFSDVFGGLVALASLFAWRNVRFGKHDQRGAFRLACFAFACTLISHISEIHHATSLAEADLFYRALRESFANAALFWVLYLGFEPYARRRWPTALVSWSRVLAGELRDPLVGSDILWGAVLGVACNLILAMAMLAAPFSSYLPSLVTSTSSVLSLWSYLLLSGVASGLSFMFLLVLLRRLVRFSWLAEMIFVIFVSLLYSPPLGPDVVIVLLARALVIVIVLCCLKRFGVLCAVTWFCILLLLIVVPITTDDSVWYFQHGLVTALAVLALTVYAFRTAVAGKPMWQKHSGIRWNVD